MVQNATPTAHTDTICPSCGQEIIEKFCSRCGEKKRGAHHFTLKHFGEESIEGITHFDGKFFGTIKRLFFSPGALTRHFEQGRNVPFMKPLQLFIVSNLLFFILVGQSNIFAISLGSYLGSDNYKKYGTVNAFNKEVSPQVPFGQVSAVFNEKLTAQSKSYILLFIPVFALACALVFLNRKRFFTLHLVFATHFFSFLLLYFTLFHFLFVLPNRYVIKMSTADFDVFAVAINLAVFIVYFTLAARRFYQIRWYGALLASVVMAYLFLLSLQAYRLFLFYKIIHSI
jgi:hypothetical protein